MDGAAPIEIVEGRVGAVGDMPVRRVLPRTGHRTVGAWCFADHMGPVTVSAETGIDVGPHPHCGLQTVTWLVAGEVLHRDSLGTEQTIAPGQLNLMTAGHGVSHSEERTGHYAGPIHGIQLWIAQPEHARHGPAAFEHHAELPTVEVGGGVATVLMGSFNGAESPARHDTDLVGVDLRMGGSPATLPLQPGFEHGIVALDGAVTVDGADVHPGVLALLAPGRDQVRIAPAGGPARIVLLGGVPLDEPILMSWNFVGRTRDELEAAHAAWNADDGRFGSVASTLARIAAPPPVWRL